jgi:aminoglycoside phosphotransferase (APT) family kinase protein
MISRIPGDIDVVDVSWIREMLGDDSVTAVETRRIGEGFGLAAETFRVDVTANRRVAPFAVKLCDGDTAASELNVYRKILPRTRVPCPELIDAARDGDLGVVVYRFVGGAQGDVLAGCSDTTLYGIVDVLADLHTSWWEQAGDAGVPAVLERMRRELTPEHVETCLGRYGHLLDDDATALVRSLPGRMNLVLDELVEHPVTIIHADAHLDNVLILDDDSPVLLDWSSARSGPAGVDLARCEVECMTAGQRRRLADDVVYRYHRHLIDRGVVGYSFESLRRAVHLARLALIPGFVRWGAEGGTDGKPPRATALLRAGLVSVTDAALAR